MLPGGLGTLGDIGAFSFQYAILPNGDVIFKARVTEGSLSPAFIYTFRWSNGTITLAQPSQETDPVTLTQAFDHDLAQVTTDDRWLATLQTGPFPTTTTDYGLTDGAARPSIFSFTRGAANCVFDTVTLAAANANGVVAYYQLLQTTPQVGGFCQGTTTRTWSVKLAGATTGTIASGSSSENGNTYTGAELSTSSLFLMNNQNQVAAVRELHNSPTTFQIRRQLVVFKSGSEEIIQDTEGPASGIFLADFDQQGRVLYSVALDDFVTTVLLGGPDLENDRVLRTGDPLFGQAVTALSWVARPAAPGDGEARAFAFQYGLDDGAVGHCPGAPATPRWTNPAGGDWGGGGQLDARQRPQRGRWRALRPGRRLCREPGQAAGGQRPGAQWRRDLPQRGIEHDRHRQRHQHQRGHGRHAGAPDDSRHWRGRQYGGDCDNSQPRLWRAGRTAHRKRPAHPAGRRRTRHGHPGLCGAGHSHSHRRRHLELAGNVAGV